MKPNNHLRIVSSTRPLLVMALILLTVSALLAQSGGGTTAAAAGWRRDVSRARVPQEGVRGRLAGASFVLERATLEANGGVLRLAQGAATPYPDREIAVYLHTPRRQGLAGRAFAAIPNLPPRVALPTVHLNLRSKAASDPRAVPNMQVFSRGYALNLRFGKKLAAENILPGEIYLCLPGSEKNWIAGTFRATMLP